MGKLTFTNFHFQIYYGKLTFASFNLQIYQDNLTCAFLLLSTFLLFSVRQLRIYNEMDKHDKTMKDFAVQCEGLYICIQLFTPRKATTRV